VFVPRCSLLAQDAPGKVQVRFAHTPQEKASAVGVGRGGAGGPPQYGGGAGGYPPYVRCVACSSLLLPAAASLLSSNLDAVSVFICCLYRFRIRLLPLSVQGVLGSVPSLADASSPASLVSDSFAGARFVRCSDCPVFAAVLSLCLTPSADYYSVSRLRFLAV
jgi:hypothetical protein